MVTQQDIEKAEKVELIQKESSKNEKLFQFAHYFEDENAPIGETCGKCTGETLLPCVPGFGCQTALCLGSETTKGCCTQWRSPPLFWSINYLALVGHLINTIITVFYFFTKEDVVYDLKEISEAWTNENGTNMCTTNMPANSFDAQLIQAGNRSICVSYSSTTTDTVSLFNLIIWFHLLSFLFQTLAMCDWNFPLFCCWSQKSSGTQTGPLGLVRTLLGFRCVRQRYVDEVIIDGTNMLRMVEYSISATLMQVAIALVLGINSRLEIMSIAALTIIVMLLGLIAEQMKNIRFKTAWFAHLLGWFAMFAVWSLIFQKFNHSVEMSEQDGGDGPPDFVFIMIATIAIMYMAFGLLQLAQLVWITLYNKTSAQFNKNIETGYNFMSLTSKTFLGTFLIANVLFAPRIIDQCLPKVNQAEWNDLGCNVTTPNAMNVTDLGDIEPATGFRSCKVKCEAMGAVFTVESEENRCDKIDNVTWWAEKGCVVVDPEARTVTELEASAAAGFDSCDVTCPEDGEEYVVNSVQTVGSLGTCDQIDCSVLEMIEDGTTVPPTMTTFWASLGITFYGDDTITCCHMPNLSSCSPFHGCQGDFNAITGDYGNIGVSANPDYKTFANCCRPYIGGGAYHPPGWVDCVLSPCDGQVVDPYN